LNGDQFTLNKLSFEPEQSQEIVGGQPFTVLTWHSALAAVKPGEFALTVETPLTVRMRTAPQRRSRSLFDDPFNDPFFQNFFGGTTEKRITVASQPDALKIEALPTDGRPAGFNGAVGQFKVSAELSTQQASVGDPLTLRMNDTGSGNFDHVQSPMLDGVSDWKTYKPTASFTPADIAGFSGEKVFEQAIIPMKAGKQSVPQIAFSYFNPETREFETPRATLIEIDVSAASSGSLANSSAPMADTREASEEVSGIPGLQPDHVEHGGGVPTLRPLYFRPWFVASQGVLAFGFVGAFVFRRFKDGSSLRTGDRRRRDTGALISERVVEMKAAAKAGDAPRFFQSARCAF